MNETKISELKADIETDKGGLMTSLSEANNAIAELRRNEFIFDDGLFLSLCLLVFSLFVFALMTYLIRLGKEPDQILKVFGSVLIVVSAVFLIIAGYSEKQIAPVIGLLGTVAGYILGKSAGNHSESNQSSGKPLGD